MPHPGDGLRQGPPQDDENSAAVYSASELRTDRGVQVRYRWLIVDVHACFPREVSLVLLITAMLGGERLRPGPRHRVHRVHRVHRGVRHRPPDPGRRLLITATYWST
ncbi:hypothetical protein ABZ464_32130 [Streptomyces sp. NPDC005820]|uniref:hypothetical protein n=1 Tax=Streptomyces sp. NPDC005820 TaxID=3157069 RepID=UPI0033EF0B66